MALAPAIGSEKMKSTLKDSSAPTDSQQLARVQRMLGELMDAYPQSQPVVSEILKYLATLSEQIATAGQQSRRSKVKPRRLTGILGYIIEHGRHGEVLVERRYDTAKDFRCPQRIYMATAKAVADAPPGGIPFDAVLERIKAELDEAPPDYLPRLCIRFWMFLKKPLIARSRARYRPVEPVKFVKAAERAWRNMADKGK